MTLYEAQYGESIKEVQSERQTVKSVFIKGQRYNWSSYHSTYFCTRQEAKDYIIARISAELEQAKNKVNKLTDKLYKAREL